MKSLLIAALSLVITHSSAFAESRRVAEKKTTTTTTTVVPEGRYYNHSHEVLINSGEFGVDEISNAGLSFNNGTKLGIGAGYFYRLNSFLQVGPRLVLVHTGTTGTSTTAFGFVGSARINFPFNHDLENAFFGGVYFGLATSSTSVGAGPSTGVTTALLGVEAGKRFLLFPNFTWQPTFALNIPTNRSYGDMSFQFRLLSASLVF